jgi:hypothetical protein
MTAEQSLGLARARPSVELHRGGSEARGAGPGQGSTFTVEFSCTSVATTPANGRASSQAGLITSVASWATRHH